jgi:hypothetical protein
MTIASFGFGQEGNIRGEIFAAVAAAFSGAAGVPSELLGTLIA